MNRMITKAQVLGADAIVGIRFSTSNITAGASELFFFMVRRSKYKRSLILLGKA